MVEVGVTVLATVTEETNYSFLQIEHFTWSWSRRRLQQIFLWSNKICNFITGHYCGIITTATLSFLSRWQERFLNLSIFKLVSFSSDDPVPAKHSRIREIFPGQLTGHNKIFIPIIINDSLVNKTSIDRGTSYVQFSCQLHHVLDLLLLVRHSTPAINLSLPAPTSEEQLSNVDVILYLQYLRVTMKVDTPLLWCHMSVRMFVDI